MLDLALLGQPLVCVDGEPVALPTRKALALVAHLALEGPTQRSRLARGLWPNIEREKARSNLRRELNRLRQTPLGRQLVSEGTTIALAPFWCDVREFAEKSDAGDFAAGLALYRGPLLDGLELHDTDEFDDWLMRHRSSLADRQRAMLAQEAKFRDESGDSRGALVRYLDLIRINPTEECHHREAMRLHYLVGEREAALERFAELKRVLRRELALEPSQETLELYRMIRSASPLPERMPSRRDEQHWPLVGRTRELARIERSERPCLLLVGDPGMGKTRLVTSSRQGLLVLRASEASHALSFHPVATALVAAWNEPGARARLETLAPTWRREVARVVPAFDATGQLGPPGEGARPRLLEGLAHALAAAAEGALLVLEDLHWFDAASVEVAFHLCQRVSALGVRLLMTARPLELPASPAQNLVDALTRARLCELVELQPLSEDDVLAILRVAHPENAGLEFARRLHRATAGNPTYLRGLLKTWSDHRAATGPSEVVPGEFREAVPSQLEIRGPKLRRVLEAARAEAPSSRDELRSESGLDAFQTLDALDVRAGFVVRDDGGTHFHHELVQRALAEGRRSSH